MLRALMCSVPLLTFVAVGSAADDKPARAEKPGVVGVVIKVDAKNHTILVRVKDADSKEIEKMFTLGDKTEVTDEAGKAAGLEVIQVGDNVLTVEKEGRLIRLQREARRETRGFDAALFLERFDKNKDGFLQREELPERYRHAFDQIDANKDGKLSREELESGAAFIQRARRPADFLNVLVETSDGDEGSMKELQYIYDVLRKMDRKNDGKLDPDALRAARDKITSDRMDEIIKDLDADNDGKISREEARGRVKRDFDKIDLNKDGFLDREELIKAAAERAAEAAPPKDKP